MLEIRSTSVEVRGNVLEGVAVPFNEYTEIREGGVTFREKFNPGSVTVPDHAVLQFSHDGGGVPLARVGAGTIKFESASDGLRFTATIPEARADIIEALERGDLDGSVSIGFYTVRDRKTPVRKGKVAYLREIEEAAMDHLAIVERPAYENAKAEFTK